MMSTNSLVCSASELAGFSLSGVFVGWGRLWDWNREPREKEELLAAMFVGGWDSPRRGLLMELWVALGKAKAGFAFVLFFASWSLGP